MDRYPRNNSGTISGSQSIDLEFDLDIDTGWHLSSDHDGMTQGASLHADYMAAWTDDPPGT